MTLLAAAPSHVIVGTLRTPGPDAVANVALIIAIITLLAMFLQILIANKTLDATLHELDLTRRALEVTNSQFDLANKQLRWPSRTRRRRERIFRRLKPLKTLVSKSCSRRIAACAISRTSKRVISRLSS